MLKEIQEEMVRTHRNRRYRRSVAGMLFSTFLVAIVFVSLNEPIRYPDDRDRLALDGNHGIEITPIMTGSGGAQPISSRGIRMAEITTPQLLQTFAEANIPAGVRCETREDDCEIFFPGREMFDDIVIQ